MLSFPLLGRSRSWAVLAALSLLSLFALSPSVRAQGYPGGGSGGGYPGGGGAADTYTVAYSGGATTATGPTDNTPGSYTLASAPGSSVPGGYAYGGGAYNHQFFGPKSVTINCKGAIKTTFTWNPGPNNDPAPAANSVIVVEQVYASWGGNSGGSASGDISGTTTGGSGGQTYTGTRYSVQGGSSFSVTCTPTASASSTAPANGSAGAFANVGYTAAVSPVTLSLQGATLDSSHNYDILVGQHCTASLVGIPSGCTVSNYQWSVTGTTFQTWSADTPSFPVMVGGVQIGIIPENPDVTYEVDGPGPLTNSTAGWYWNDLAKGTGNNTQETVSCTATVTPPTGQGAALTVTATTPITVWTPVWTATGNGASVVVDNTFQAPDFWLHAGPGPLDFGATRGMTWDATLSPPSAPVPFGIGSLAIVQIITGCDQGMTSNTTPPLSIPGPGNGQTGLDTSWPYGWTISTTIVGGMKYESGDSPGIRVTNLRSAHDNISFEDYLMYCPPSSVQYVPLAKYIWSANMGASLPATGNWINFTGTAGTVTDAQKTGRFLPNNTFPAWTDIVTAQ